MKNIFITSGDPDGIGPEVTIKALEKVGPKKEVRFVVFSSSRDTVNPWKRLNPRFKRNLNVTQWPDAFSNKNFERSQLVLIQSSAHPATWVETCAKICLSNTDCSMVTAPLSKELIASSGLTALGHTEILQNISGVDRVHMGFIGSKFHVVLATGHLPIQEISRNLNEKTVRSAIESAHLLLKLPTVKNGRKRMAVLGLNPHAGNSNLIGHEDSASILPAIKWAQSKGLQVDGPFSPDSAFIAKNIRQYGVFICMYHDQGLIPFKMAHGFKSGVHITLGLPFLRSSVDHGTAKDLFGKNKAEAASMIEALKIHL